MKKCLLAFAAIAAFAASTARADLLDYSMVADGVYSSTVFATSNAIAGATVSANGENVTLPAGVTSGYVRMAILATINNTGPTPISEDGIAEATLSVVGSASSGLGTASYIGNAAKINNGTNMGNSSGNPAGGNTTAKYKHNWSSPVQGYATWNSNSTAVSAYTQWSTNFTATGYKAGTATGLTVGQGAGAYTAGNLSTAIIPVFSVPSVPPSASLVNYNSAGISMSVSAANSGDAVQPGSPPNTFLLGASGVTANSATFVLGELDFQFTGATGGGTATVQVVPANCSTVAAAESANFDYAGVATQAGYQSTVTGYSQTTTSGASGSIGSLGPVTIVLQSSGTVAANWAKPQLTIASGPTATPSFVSYSSVYGSSTATIAGMVSNPTYTPSSGTQDSVNWALATSGNVGTLSGANLSGSGLAVGSSAAYSVKYTAPTGFFGPDNIVFTPTGTGSNGGGALNNTPTVGTATINVIGLATRAGADGSGVFGTYGTPLATTALSNSASLAGMETTLGTTASYGIGQTSAEILAGNLTASSTGISMAWRARASNELPSYATAHGGPAAGYYPLYSDVVSVTGVSGSSAVYTMEMSYDPSQLGGSAAADAAASNGFLFLGSRTGSSGNDWQNAVAANVGVGADASTKYIGTYAAFTAANSQYSLSQLLGSWGVDTADNEVWAIVNHDAEFAAVPEPGTLGLLAAGLAAIGFAYRRRKAAKA